MSRFEFKLPDIGEGIAEAELVEWLVEIGDTIAEDQQIAAGMTDKATVELESPVAGKIVEIKVKEGDKVSEGTVIMVFEGEASGDAPAPAKSEAPAKEAPKAAQATGTVFCFSFSRS